MVANLVEDMICTAELDVEFQCNVGKVALCVLKLSPLLFGLDVILLGKGLIELMVFADSADGLAAHDYISDSFDMIVEYLAFLGKDHKYQLLSMLLHRILHPSLDSSEGVGT